MSAGFAEAVAFAGERCAFILDPFERSTDLGTTLTVFAFAMPGQ